MEVILKKNVDNLGYTNELVSVKNGYGRNFLIPQGYAILANGGFDIEPTLIKSKIDENHFKTRIVKKDEF